MRDGAKLDWLVLDEAYAAMQQVRKQPRNRQP
jgi:hypothetical protein